MHIWIKCRKKGRRPQKMIEISPVLRKEKSQHSLVFLVEVFHYTEIFGHLWYQDMCRIKQAPLQENDCKPSVKKTQLLRRVTWKLNSLGGFLCLRSLFLLLYIFLVQLLITRTALDVLTQCFLCMLFVQTGNQHIYQPVGKPGNRHNSNSLQLQSYNCWHFIPWNSKLQYIPPVWTQSLQIYSMYPTTFTLYYKLLCLQISGFLLFYSIKHWKYWNFQSIFLTSPLWHCEYVQLNLIQLHNYLKH